MASSQVDSEWDKSTSEIQSEDSDDLFASRPNRWHGPPQSWRTLTEEDRLTVTTLDRLRNQDLSVHLYNAFSLKHPTLLSQPPLVPAGPDDAATRPWAPPKSWTAWPLQARLVPPDDFMKKTEEEDEEFTFRRAEREAPGGQLEEVVSAAILRCAKEKFRKRQLGGTEQRPAKSGKEVKRGHVSSGDDFVSSAPESDKDEDDGATPTKALREEREAVEKSYRPAIATDDDASYALIRPSTRMILSKLDQTLAILHNACATSSRHNTTNSASASSASEAEEGNDDLYHETARRSRSRTTKSTSSRSRDSSLASTAARSLSRDDDASPSKPKSTRGRKAASVPREGESERDFLLRRAREQKKKRPVFTDEEDDAGGTTDARSPSRRRRRTTRGRRRKSPGGGEVDEFWLQKKLDRFHLRDWSDVMGAAALAGFDARIIERATQRCADLFGQGMEMHTIDEGAGVSTRRYVPGQVVLSSGSEDEGGNEDLQSRATSRRSSLAHSRAVSLASGDDDDDDRDYDDDRARRELESARKRRRRSSSRGSMLEACYCHHADCERSTRSFAKPFNLRRHLERVHGEVSTPQVSQPSTPRIRTPRARTPQPRATPQAEAMFYCTHADCDRATRPFDKGHNLKRHLERVHGEGLPARRKDSGEPAVAEYLCPHAGCERATRGFVRNPNLVRHLKLVHGQAKSKDRGKSTQKPSPGGTLQDHGYDESESAGDSSSGSDSK